MQLSETPGKFAELALAPELIDDTLVVVKLTEDEDLQLLAEKDVVGQDDSPREDPAEEVKRKVLRDVKSQLRTILSTLPVSRLLKTSENLVDSVRAESMVMESYESRDFVTQAGEATRLLRLLPDSYRANNFTLLHDEMVLEVKKRAPYVTYLVKTKQDLALTLGTMHDQRNRVEQTHASLLTFFKVARVRWFIDKRELEVQRFLDIFKGIPTPLEKVKCLTQFISSLAEQFALDPYGKKISGEQKAELFVIVEREFVSRIYPLYDRHAPSFSLSLFLQALISLP